MNIVRTMLVLLLCSWTVSAQAIGFSNPFVVLPAPKQAVIRQNFGLIDRAATKVGVDPQTIQAISLVETRGGIFGVAGNLNIPPSARSYGLMQIQPTTALVLIRDHPELKDEFFNGITPSREHVIQFLITNTYGSAVFASYLFKDYSAMLNSNWCLTVLGYNMGIGVALKAHRCEQNVYVQDVRWFLNHIVQKYNIVDQ